MHLLEIINGPPEIRAVLMQVLSEEGAGENIQLVSFDASFIDEDGNQVDLKDKLHFINNTFHLDALYQIECYLIFRYRAARFKTNTVVKNVSSRKLQDKNPARVGKTGRGNKVLPESRG